MAQKSCCNSSGSSPISPNPSSSQKTSLPLSAYTPLFVIILVTALCAAALQLSIPSCSRHQFMHHFMGFFLGVFAMVKLFNLTSFATGFAKYDLLAARSRCYALLYPFLELALGLAYLAHWQPPVTYLATIILLLFGTLGVIRTMLQGKQLNCACMGQLLKVPVSTVTLTENLSMVAMAAFMLFN